MADNWKEGTRILLDASGPESIFGLLRNGIWLEFMVSSNAFLEDCQSMVEYLVSDTGLSLEELSGVIYAAGPGSTLGLRLAAMFLRSLLQLPQLKHWQCFQYNNLELAAASLVEEGHPLPVVAVAPWRRDKVHRVTVTGCDPLERHIDAVHPDTLDPVQTAYFLMGNRPSRLPAFDEATQLPANRIPAVLGRFPEVLVSCAHPVPFNAEAPEFVRWSARRHSSE